MPKNRFTLRCQQYGMTLVEMLVSVSILMVVIGISSSVYISVSRNQEQIRARNIMRSESETMLFRLASKLNQARMLMNNDTLGQKYLSKADLSAAPPMLSSSTMDTLLPTIRPDGSLAPEKNCVDFPNNFFRANSVGNVLMFARYIGKFSKFSFASAAQLRALDLYEFKLFYLTDDSNTSTWNIDRALSGTSVLRRLRLVEWTSQRYVDYDQLTDYLVDAPTNADRSQIRSDLATAGLNYAWRRNGTVYQDNVPSGAGNADIFFNVGTGTSNSLTRASNHTILARSSTSAMHYDQDAYSISYNTQPNAASPRYFPIGVKVPYLYNDYSVNPPACPSGTLPANNGPSSMTPTSSKNGFPGGFEVMVVGPPSGRNILIHLTTTALVNRYIVTNADMISAFARDL